MVDRPNYVVMDENVLGYMYGDDATTVWVLRSSILRGGPAHTDSLAAPMDRTRLRPATKEDFESFMVCSKGYFD